MRVGVMLTLLAAVVVSGEPVTLSVGMPDGERRFPIPH